MVDIYTAKHYQQREKDDGNHHRQTCREAYVAQQEHKSGESLHYRIAHRDGRFALTAFSAEYYPAEYRNKVVRLYSFTAGKAV